jgi:predicted porin
MKKTLIASAITAATLSTSTFAMDPATDLAERLDSMPEIYGNIQLVHKSTDLDGASAHEFGDNGSTIGFKHSSAVSEGVEAFFKAEFHFDADDNASANKGLGEKLDEAYIGVKGEFGMVQAGTDDTVYEWIDMVDTYEAIGLDGEIAALKEGDNLQYVSPEIADGLMIGVTIPVDSDTNFGGSLAAKYSMDNLEVALAYSMGREENGVDAEDTIGLAGTYTMGDISLIAQYETKDKDKDFIGLQGMYTMGQNVFSLGYGMTSFDNSALEDQSDIYVQALHSMSDNMYVYLEYKTTTDYLVEDATSNDGIDLDQLAIGATYAF